MATEIPEQFEDFRKKCRHYSLLVDITSQPLDSSVELDWQMIEWAEMLLEHGFSFVFGTRTFSNFWMTLVRQPGLLEKFHEIVLDMISLAKIASTDPEEFAKHIGPLTEYFKEHPDREQRWIHEREDQTPGV